MVGVNLSSTLLSSSAVYKVFGFYFEGTKTQSLSVNLKPWATIFMNIQM